MNCIKFSCQLFSFLDKLQSFAICRTWGGKSTFESFRDVESASARKKSITMYYWWKFRKKIQVRNVSESFRLKKSGSIKRKNFFQCARRVFVNVCVLKKIPSWEFFPNKYELSFFWYNDSNKSIIDFVFLDFCHKSNFGANLCDSCEL